MKIYGLKLNNRRYEPVIFENINIKQSKEQYVLNVSDYVFETIKLLLLQRQNQQNNGQIIEFFNQIDELEDIIMVSELEEKEYSDYIDHTSFCLMNKIADFLNWVGNDNGH